MYVDHARIIHPQGNSPLCVSAIYRLMADRTYQVEHPALEAGSRIFVYTDLGQGIMACKEGTFALETGTILLFSADSPFFYHTAADQWNFWWFEFQGAAPCQSGNLYFPKEDDWLGRICRRALEALHTENAPAAASYLSCLLALAAESVQIETNSRQKLFFHAQAMIKENLCHINVASLAHALRIDPRTLYNLFQHYAGTSPKSYLRSCVMDQAKYRLANTTKTIAQIADEMGFSSPFHFSRVFRETFGLSPSAFRQQIRRIYTDRLD